MRMSKFMRISADAELRYTSNIYIYIYVYIYIYKEGELFTFYVTSSRMFFFFFFMLCVVFLPGIKSLVGEWITGYNIETFIFFLF